MRLLLLRYDSLDDRGGASGKSKDTKAILRGEDQVSAFVCPSLGQ